MYFTEEPTHRCKEASWVFLLGIISSTIAGCETTPQEVNGTIGSHTNWVEGVAFSPDGKLLVTGGWDRSKETAELLVWDSKTGQLKMKLKGHQKPVTDVAFSPKGDMLASASLDGTIRFWKPTTGKEVRKLALDELKLGGCLAFSPDGTILTSAADGALWFWDVHTGKELAKVNAHRYGPYRLAFSPDGKFVASCFGNLEGDTLKENTVKLWDADSRQLRLTIEDMDSNVKTVVFMRDSKTLAVGCEEGTVIFQGLYGEKNDEA